MPKLIDWTGQIFNGCEILQPVDNNYRSSQALWDIKCHCGNIFEAKPNNLKTGNTKSCSCLSDLNIIETHKKNQKDWAGKIFNNCKILEPVDKNKITCIDKWKIKCYCGNIFENTPTKLQQEMVKSCGCLLKKTANKLLTEANKKRRLNRGLLEDEYLLDMQILIRKMLFIPIRTLIFILDKKCALCSGRKYHVHHIIPLYTIKYDDISTYSIAYDINNLITLCEDCHLDAHNNNGYSINIVIQKKLQNITKNRIISQNIQEEYNKIVEEKIKPWLSDFLTKERQFS